MRETGTDAPTDLDLLRIQAEMTLNDRGRLRPPAVVTLRTAREGRLLFVGEAVPDRLVAVLEHAVASSPVPAGPGVAPAALAECRRILEGGAALVLATGGGPYYLFDGDVACEPVAGIGTIETSEQADVERLRGLNPGNWEPNEWDDLLDAPLGPWAIALSGGEVVSICHTPLAMSDRAAECGVWTAPERRGRGYASSVAAAWAGLLRPTGRFLYYSTSADNRSSQGVAGRLGLRPIGWTWTLTGGAESGGSSR